ncbi:hypothetical protein [Amycolatopsis sp. NPDC004169]|uniref:hypothetical protein n=1 Tax=Amycolatopsis sp. NPDC004169 TaxID=3154453 RepID=UPI0033BBB6C9
MTEDRRPTAAPTYLDDPDLQLVVDDADADADADAIIGELLERDPADAHAVVRGAAMLFAAKAGTAAECLATSLTWLYG